MFEMITEAKTDKLPDVLAFLEKTLEERDCAPKTSIQLAVALEEMFVNIANYAYEGSSLPESEKTARIVIEDCTVNDSPAVRITLYDKGMKYDPLAKEDPDTTLSADERDIGGLGIYMVKKSMDTVSYRRDGDLNVFAMEKAL